VARTYKKMRTNPNSPRRQATICAVLKCPHLHPPLLNLVTVGEFGFLSRGYETNETAAVVNTDRTGRNLTFKLIFASLQVELACSTAPVNTFRNSRGVQKFWSLFLGLRDPEGDVLTERKFVVMAVQLTVDPNLTMRWL